MTRYIISRLVQFPLILAVIYLGTFFMTWIAPGDPFQQTERRLDPRVLDERRRQLHAEHWYTFLPHYTGRVLFHFDFGPSLQNQVFSVNEMLGTALPRSLTLGTVAIIIAVLLGVMVGIVSAVSRGGPSDWLGLGVSLVGISLPSFVVAMVLLMLLARYVEWFPIGGWAGMDATSMKAQMLSGDWGAVLGQFGRFCHHLVLPAIALSLLPMAYIARLTRVSMLDVLSSDYVRTARAKGLSRWTVIRRHALRNAFLPVLSFLGPATAATLTGSFVVEQVFQIRPAMGTYFVDAVRNRDATLILGTVMTYSLILLALNLTVDLLYAVVDPRIDVTRRHA